MPQKKSKKTGKNHTPDKVTTVIKVKLFPNNEQIPLLVQTMSQYMKACNLVSEKVCELRDHYWLDLNNQLYRKVRELFGLKSNVTQSVFRAVDAKYKQVEDKLKQKKKLTGTQRQGHLYSKPVVFKVPECDLVRGNDYSLLKDGFSLYIYTSGQKSRSRNRIKIAYEHRYVDTFLNNPKYKLGTATLKRIGNKFYLFVPITEKVTPFRRYEIQNIIGIDRGIRFIATSYDSRGKTSFYKGDKTVSRRIHFKNKRAELQRKGTPSARRRLKSIGRRENRWMRDVNHCVSKTLVNKYPEKTLFVIEDLTGIQKSTKRVKKKRRYVQVSWAYYDFEKKLMYKALRNGSLVIKMPAKYTSQRCPVCGHVQKSNRDHERHKFCCYKCRYRSNDDRIGAMNLFLMGKFWKENQKLETEEIKIMKDGNTIPVFGAESRVPNVTPCLNPKGIKHKEKSLPGFLEVTSDT